MSHLENPNPDEAHLDPIIDGLLDRLPAPGEVWPMANRNKWLQVLTLSLGLIYEDEPTPSA
jgi:hypothetical protein